MKRKKNCGTGMWCGEEEKKNLWNESKVFVFVVGKCLCRRGRGQWLGWSCLLSGVSRSPGRAELLA